MTQRLILPGQDTFVKLEDGSGWLFESKRGVVCLRGLPLEYGLFVYRVLRQPNMPLLVRPDVTAEPPKVQSHLQVRLPNPSLSHCLPTHPALSRRGGLHWELTAGDGCGAR